MVLSSKAACQKVLFDSLGLVEFAFGLVNSFLNLHNVQMKFFERIQITEELLQIPLIKIFARKLILG